MINAIEITEEIRDAHYEHRRPNTRGKDCELQALM
jgi:hypothetical protein